MIFRFSSHMSSLSLRDFSSIDLCPVFLPNLSSLGWEVFHQRHDYLKLISYLTGLRCSHWPSSFPPQSPIIGLGGFSLGSHSRFPFKVSIPDSPFRFPSKFPFSKFHAQRSLRPKRGAIVIMWPLEWKSYDNYQPQLQLIRFDFHHGVWFLLIYITQ